MKSHRGVAAVLGIVAAAVLGADARAVPSAYVALLPAQAPARIGQFTIARSGTLAPKRPARVGPAVGAIGGIAVLPDGRSAYATSTSVDLGSGERPDRRIWQYDVVARTGVLRSKRPRSAETGEGPTGVAVAPSGRSVYVSNGSADDVSQFSVRAPSGRLVSKGPARVHSGSSPGAIAVTPDGRDAYVANYATNFVTQFSIDRRSGVLFPKAPTIVRAGLQPVDLAVSPNGRSVYVSALGTVAQFDIEPVGGRLVPKNPPAVPADAPRGLAVGPDGRSVYVAVSSGIAQYDADPNTGALTPKDPAVVSVPGFPVPGLAELAVSADGRRLYATSERSPTLFQFRVGNRGKLQPASPLGVDAGALQSAIVLLPDAPAARFSARARPGKATFDASSSADPGGRIARFAWSFGDGHTAVSNRARVVHAYRRPGRYRVTLSVTSAAGCGHGDFVYTGQTATCNGRRARSTRIIGIAR